jgi:fatty acid desaturase
MGAVDVASNDIPLSLKGELVDEHGVPYRDFRSRLKPRWGRVWFELAAAYLVLALVLAGIVVLAPSWLLALPVVVVGGLVIGYTIHFINCFFHEAAHYNILPDRRANDLVTNGLMGWLFGSSVSLYRKIHWQHHRALGTTMDSENSYFDALGIGYLVRGITGFKALRTMRQYRRMESSGQPAGDRASRLIWLAIAASVNAGIAAALVLLGSAAAAIAWLIGLLVVFPFVGSLRQLLEHRSESADPQTDYHEIDHGPVNRLFGDGPLASTVGSAGFNRHAIHHWEPQLSYTRLADVESYLLRTDAAPLVHERQTTYVHTFLRLLEP